MAVGDLLQVLGTPVTFKSAAGTVAFTPTSVAGQAGRKSDVWDRGASPQPEKYSWRAKTAMAGTPRLGAKIDLYIATSDGTIIDGGVTADDAAFTDKSALKNMLHIGSLVVDSVTTDAIKGSGVFRMHSRYGVLILWNNTASEVLSSTAGDHEVILTPIHERQVQA